MHNLRLTKEAHDFIRGLEAKQFKQVLNKVLSLLVDPFPIDSNALKGYAGIYRVDQGEYRIVYRFDDKTVSVLVVGKRNDGDVYRQLERKNL